MNSRNFFELNVEVTPVFYLKWLEDHIEIEKDNEIEILNVIAVDKLGRKFTNCTAVYPRVEIIGAKFMQLE